MSPSDLGQHLKPFVFLDIFNADKHMVQAMQSGKGMPIHPHSGVATVTVFTKGTVRFDDPEAGTGELTYGGVEWMRAGNGVWHGQEMTPKSTSGMQGFQLWLALPPEVENGRPENRYIEANDMPQVGPAYLIVGRYDGIDSPVPAPEGTNYLLVTLKPGERWTYTPPQDHSLAWLALANGSLNVNGSVSKGEMVLFENGDAALEIQSTSNEDAVFVLGSAVPHPYQLHLGNYSVHTSAEALKIGEDRIKELGKKLREAGDRQTASGTVPVYR
ncbi:pirin family protein [Marinomonas posidonica]|uniref:pirin family protein n=1 Tax=Marinomonas posidonica TaxID=936476 RepID=UPI0037353AD3